MTSISRLMTCSQRNRRSSIVIRSLIAEEAPYRPRIWKPVRYRTASRNVFEGMVPVLMQTPPTTSRRSQMPTLFPSLAACTAARWPAGPVPMTNRSNGWSMDATGRILTAQTPGRKTPGYAASEQLAPRFERRQVEGCVQVQENSGVVPGQLHDARRAPPHHRLETLSFLADPHQLGEQGRAEQGRMAGSPVEGRHDDAAPPGGIAFLPFGFGGVKERVQQPRFQRLVDRGHEDPVGRRGDRRQAGLDRGALAVTVAGVVDRPRLPARPHRRPGERLKVRRVLAEDDDALLQAAFLDLLQLVGKEGLAAPFQERFRGPHALRLACREKNGDDVHQIVPRGTGPAAAPCGCARPGGTGATC